MSKRNNISYVKPQDPSFLAKLKAQIQYQDPIEAKRQKLQQDSDPESDFEREDEKPQVVVLKEGDLTAEDAAREEEKNKTAAAEAKADLNKPIVFKNRKPKDCDSKSIEKSSHKEHKKSKASQKSSSKLSFVNEDEEEED